MKSSQTAHVRVARALASETQEVHLLLSPSASEAHSTPAGRPTGGGFALIVWALALCAMAVFFVQGGGLVDRGTAFAPASRLLANARLGVAAAAAAAAAGRPLSAGGGAAGEEAYQPPAGETELIAELTSSLESATVEREALEAELHALRGGGGGGGGGGPAGPVGKLQQGSPVQLMDQLTEALGAATREVQRLDAEFVQLLGGGARGGGRASAAAAPAAAAPAAAVGGAAAPLPLPPPAAILPALSPAPADPELAAALRELPALPLPPTAAGAPPPCAACLRYGASLLQRLCVPAACPISLPSSEGGAASGSGPAAPARVISTSLYGSSKRYTGGVLRNAELMPAVFPGWVLRVYTKADMLPPAEVLAELKRLGAEVIELPAARGAATGFGMNWRFLVADDAGVEAFLARDADSRVSLRDRWAAEDWLRHGQPFHVVRDHPSHAGYKLMGGTWGARTAVFRGPLPPMASILQDYVARRGHGDYGADIEFLSESLWGHMARLGVTQHDSHSCGAGNHGVAGAPFPLPRAGTEHVGAVYEFDGQGREAVRDMDLVLLVGHRGAPDCVPPALPAVQRAALAPAAALQEAEVVDAGALRARLAAASAGGDGGGGARAFATAWSSGAGGDAGMCAHRARAHAAAPRGAATCRPALLAWRDAFVDGLRAAPAPHTFLFTYEAHVAVGAAGGAPPPPQYHERVPEHLEPIAALDGGVRYAPALAVVEEAMSWEAALGAGGADADAAAAAAAAFASEDLPRLLRALARPGALLLLPPRAARAVRTALQEVDGGAAMAQHVVEHEGGAGALYFAAEALLLLCTCAVG